VKKLESGLSLKFEIFNKGNEILKTHRGCVAAPFNQLFSETIASERSLNVSRSLQAEKGAYNMNRLTHLILISSIIIFVSTCGEVLAEEQTIHKKGSVTDKYSNEKGYWGKARSINTIDSYKKFLKLYPRGKFATEAHLQLKVLKQVKQLGLTNLSVYTARLDSFGKEGENATVTLTIKGPQTMGDVFIPAGGQVITFLDISSMVYVLDELKIGSNVKIFGGYIKDIGIWIPISIRAQK